MFVLIVMSVGLVSVASVGIVRLVFIASRNIFSILSSF